MNNVRVVLHLKGVNELMKSAEIQTSLDAAGEAVAQAAGGEYGIRGHKAQWIGVTNVFPNSKEAAQDNYRNNTLEKAISTVGLKRSKR